MSQDSLQSRGGKGGGFKDKLRGIFHLSRDKDSFSESNPQSPSAVKESSTAFVFTVELVKAINRDHETADRISQIQKLQSRLQECSVYVEIVWDTVKDLLNPNILSPKRPEEAEMRIETQYMRLDIMRGILFDAIQEEYDLALSDRGNLDEIPLIFEWLSVLTATGTDIAGFEEDIGPLLIKWTEEFLLVNPDHPRVFIPDWLEFLANVISKNAAFLDETHTGPVVDFLCIFAGQTERLEEEEGCLAVLDFLVSFAIFPQNLMFRLMSTLCRLVNSEPLCQKCWKLMQNIFSSYMGFDAMNTLLNILQVASAEEKTLRGAVFFVGMGLWSSQKVTTLYYSPTAALPSLKAALVVDSHIVTFEILLSLERLASKYGKDLQMLTWDHILSTLDEILSLPSSMASAEVRARFHRILDCIERLSDKNDFAGSSDKLFTLVEKCSKDRSEESILRLLSYRSQAINPLRSGWIEDLRHLLDLYYCRDSRASVRIKVIDILGHVYTLQKHLYGDELVEHVVIPLFSDLEKETDSDVQRKALDFLCDIAKTLQQRGCGILATIKTASAGVGVKTSTDFFFEIIGILEKVINGHLDVVKRKETLTRTMSTRKSLTSSVSIECEDTVFEKDPDCSSEVSTSLSERAAEYLNNVEQGVKKIVEILEATWRFQANHVFHMLKVLASHVQLEYDHGLDGSIAASTRHQILDLILKIRANPVTYRLGHQFSTSTVIYSPYASVYDPFDEENEDNGTEDEGPCFKWTRCARVVTTCLNRERFWLVLKIVFANLPALLHNRILVLSTRNEIPTMCSALLSFVDDPKRIKNLIGAPENFTGSDLAEIICPSLAAMVMYKDCLPDALQRKLVMGIQGSLNSERSFEAVLATVSCILEMPSAVLPMTRDLVRRLAEVKMVARIAIPIVELLSTLLRLPKLYEQFSEKDFRNVIKCLVPCTRVAQYNSFIVAVAYHIIYRWMLKTPLDLRPALAKHTLSSLREANLCVQAKRNSVESSRKSGDSLDTEEEDASLKESSSTENATRLFANLNSDLQGLMSEFCKHFCYTNSPADGGKSSVLTEVLEREGWAKSWILGDRVVTVSTLINREAAGAAAAVMGSGDVSNAGEVKFCAKCQAWLNRERGREPTVSFKEPPSASSEKQSGEDFGEKRRRHASALQNRVTRRPSGTAKVSLDDTAIVRGFQRYGGSQELRFNFPSTPMPKRARGGLPMCSCWCNGFAAVEIQHPFGKTFWLVQISGAQMKEIELGGNNGAIERWAVMRLRESENWMELDSPFFSPIGGGNGRNRSCSESPITTAGIARNLSDGALVRAENKETEFGEALSDGVEMSRNSSISARSGSVVSNSENKDSGGGGDMSSPLTIDVGQKTHADFLNTPASSHSGSTYLSARSEALSRARAAANMEFGILAQDYAQVDPAWVFHQLCNFLDFEEKEVIQLPDSDPAVARSLHLLDTKPAYELHQIGVLYAGPRQSTEAEYLGNQFGSERYSRFISGLGSLVHLTGSDPSRICLGGLDTSGKDGQFTYHWRDPITQVLFHVATLMPNREQDPNFLQKKRHIGNDFVILVYNDSGAEYKLGSIRGDFSYVAIVVTPVDVETVAVKLIAKDEISRWLSIKELVVSDLEAPLLCRQIAMRADFSARVWLSQRDSDDSPYISAYMERLQHIHKLRDKYKGSMQS